MHVLMDMRALVFAAHMHLQRGRAIQDLVLQ